MKEIKTKVLHSESKPAWNVVSTKLGGKYKIARIPYLIIEGSEEQTTKEKYEALIHAEFISKCFNNSDKIIDKIFKQQIKNTTNVEQKILYSNCQTINENLYRYTIDLSEKIPIDEIDEMILNRFNK